MLAALRNEARVNVLHINGGCAIAQPSGLNSVRTLTSTESLGRTGQADQFYGIWGNSSLHRLGRCGPSASLGIPKFYDHVETAGNPCLRVVFVAKHMIM